MCSRLSPLPVGASPLPDGQRGVCLSQRPQWPRLQHTTPSGPCSEVLPQRHRVPSAGTGHTVGCGSRDEGSVMPSLSVELSIPTAGWWRAPGDTAPCWAQGSSCTPARGWWLFMGEQEGKDTQRRHHPALPPQRHPLPRLGGLPTQREAPWRGLQRDVADSAAGPSGGLCVFIN